MRASTLVFVSLVGCSEFSLKEVDPDKDVRDLEVDPGLLDFGILPLGSEVTDVVTLTSTGSVPVTVSAVDFEGADAFTVTLPGDDLALAPGESIEVLVTYSPETFADEAALTVKSDGLTPEVLVPLLGAGTVAALVADPSPDFLYSTVGEPVSNEVTITSIGTIDLVLYEMIVQGEHFGVVGDLPVTLAPGEHTRLTVTYTPEAEGEIVEGKIWLRTSTTSGDAVVPLIGQEAPGCMGLGEAWDRGALTAQLGFSNGLRVSNRSDEDVCIDAWYVWLSDTSQDLGAGDMDGDAGDSYPTGSLTLSAGGFVDFEAEARAGDAWYCMEQTQYTSRRGDYEFLGARVPEPLLSFMQDGDQDGSWAWQLDNPVILAGRGTNLVEIPSAGGSAPVTLRILNMGGEAGSAEVREPVPAGASASDFSEEPVSVETNDLGETVYVFRVDLKARRETNLYEQTDYDEVSLSYTLTMPDCLGRQYASPMETRWLDSDGEPRTNTANPLAIVCE